MLLLGPGTALLRLHFERLQPFFEPTDTGFGFNLIKIAFRIAINEPRNTLAQLGDLFVHPGRIRCTRRSL